MNHEHLPAFGGMNHELFFHFAISFCFLHFDFWYPAASWLLKSKIGDRKSATCPRRQQGIENRQSG